MKNCSDANVAALPTCGSTIGALADAAGATGCLIESIDGSVDDALLDELGSDLPRGTAVAARRLGGAAFARRVTRLVCA